MTTNNAQHRWVVDSIEESVASVEVDGDRMATVPQSLLPAGVKPGDVLSVRQDQSSDGQRSVLTIEIDEAATKQALAASAAQIRKGSRQKNDPGGDIVL